MVRPVHKRKFVFRWSGPKVGEPIRRQGPMAAKCFNATGVALPAKNVKTTLVGPKEDGPRPRPLKNTVVPGRPRERQVNLPANTRQPRSGKLNGPFQRSQHRGPKLESPPCLRPAKFGFSTKQSKVFGKPAPVLEFLPLEKIRIMEWNNRIWVYTFSPVARIIPTAQGNPKPGRGVI